MEDRYFEDRYAKTLVITRSPIDARTVMASRVLRAVALPVKTNNLALQLPVKDQGELPICAGCAGSADQELMDVIDIGLNEWLSSMFLYNNRENTSQDGMYILDLMKIRQKKGTCLDRLYPIGSTKEPSQDAMVSALNHRISLYAQVDTLDALKTVMASGRSCIIAVPVYNYTGRMWYKRSGDTFMGGHAMLAVDYNDETRKILIKNSWGTSWANKGYTEMDYDDFHLAWEWWAAIDLPSEKPIPDPDPEPEPKPTPEPEEKSWVERNLWWLLSTAVLIVILVLVLK